MNRLKRPSLRFDEPNSSVLRDWFFHNEYRTLCYVEEAELDLDLSIEQMLEPEQRRGPKW